MIVRLNFKERKFILKYYYKCENAVEVQRQFRREFQRGTVYNQCFRINFLSSKLSLTVILLLRVEFAKKHKQFSFGYLQLFKM